MKARLPYLLLAVAAVAAWWVSDHVLIPWVQDLAGYRQIQDRDLSVLLGHWVFGQGPRVLLCVLVWVVAARFGLMPSFLGSLGSGGSWARVVRTGLIASAILLVVTVALGAAIGKFGFHPPWVKMAGDLLSNLYEEIVYRGLMLSAFYGLAAAAAFPLEGKLDRAGMIVGTVASCVIFAASHEQYPVPLRVVLGVVSVVFAYPWLGARSLWAPWIVHMLGDVVGDTILKI